MSPAPALQSSPDWRNSSGATKAPCLPRIKPSGRPLHADTLRWSGWRRVEKSERAVPWPLASHRTGWGRDRVRAWRSSWSRFPQTGPNSPGALCRKWHQTQSDAGCRRCPQSSLQSRTRPRGSAWGCCNSWSVPPNYWRAGLQTWTNNAANASLERFLRNE